MNQAITRRTALGYAALLAVAARGASAQGLPSVRVATLPVDVSAQAFYADAQGFFKGEGLDAQVQIISGGPAIAAGVSSGALDFGASNSLTIALAYQRNIPFAIVAPAGSYESKGATTKLFVAKTSPIKSARDLSGKTIATNSLGVNIASIGVSAWIDKNGGDSKSVKFVEIPFAEMPVAIASGRVDAGSMDTISLSRSDGDALRALAAPYDAIAPEWLQGVWFTTVAYAQAHPDIVQRFAKAMAESADWANAHQADSAKILENATKVPVPPGTPRVHYPPWLVRSQVLPLIEAAQKYGAIKPDFDVNGLLAPGISFR
jgi:NitT/TauT family transport system substrate-binding protein